MATAKKTVTIVQTGSSKGKGPGMEETLLGLGLRRINSSSTLEDTPSVRGMITRVRHLVRVEEKG
jgi:large subunit ribosomal protein L30